MGRPRPGWPDVDRALARRRRTGRLRSSHRQSSTRSNATGAMVGPGEVEVARILAGIPALGAELSERTIPAETGLVTMTVSFEKGCYTGQELVARIDSRGSNVARHIRHLRFSEDGGTRYEPVPRRPGGGKCHERRPLLRPGLAGARLGGPRVRKTGLRWSALLESGPRGARRGRSRTRLMGARPRAVVVVLAAMSCAVTFASCGGGVQTLDIPAPPPTSPPSSAACSTRTDDDRRRGRGRGYSYHHGPVGPPRERFAERHSVRSSGAGARCDGPC